MSTKATTPLPKGLPKALRPWSQVFQDMPEVHLRLIGDLMGQLNPLLRQAFAMEAQSYGEFNGYDGMAMRGEIERLLPSEWLWKELAPDEFVRRFAEQELLYHRPSFESPTDERTHLVALDCGPDMLGRPRLVALAALLCLNALARTQGARLLWAAPQADVKTWQALLTQSDLQAFLLSANPISLRADELAELAGPLLAGQGAGKGERMLWTIGAVPLAPGDETIKTNQIVISERMALAPDGSPVAEARVRLISHYGRQTETVLAFPTEEDCVSLLRRPFDPRPVGTVLGEGSRRVMAGETTPTWAPQEVVWLDGIGRLILRVSAGILSLQLNALGELEYPVLIPLESCDDLLGLRWAKKAVILAVIRDHDSVSNLQIRRYAINPDGGLDRTDIQLQKDDPLVIDKHPRNALPPLIRPGHKFRLIAITRKGQRYVLDKKKAVPQSCLPLIGYRNGCVFTPSGTPAERLIIARSVASSGRVFFQLPPNATVSDINDFVWWWQSSSRFLLARCDDGHWRGKPGMRGRQAHDQFAAEWIDLDLSGQGWLVPIGQEGIPGSSNCSVWFCSLEDYGIHHCKLTPSGGISIPPSLNMTGIQSAQSHDPSAPGERRLRLILCNSFAVAWEVDDQGYVTRINGGYQIDGPWQEKMPYHDVSELIGKAKCLPA